ncbi:glycoside hydrolase family 19 protein [Entomohabitans teleogrylli]|uniref:glycoside hydrolase family 19 protein n=1 Tax=Entomohabitans teleogrylli TaxID=1384589 RepID=UPI0008FC924B|nr:glycoside hydrolase family 19 protein [Entomohabitans teleogrylli]
MDLSQFEQAAGLTPDEARRWIPHMRIALSEQGIRSPRDRAMFIAMIGHESQDFTRLVESFDYIPSVLQRSFNNRISWDQARILGATANRPANQEAIANVIYGGAWGREHLGNESWGDGWTFRGRGLLKVTGRQAYQNCSLTLGINLIAQPELLERDEYAVRSAAWLYACKGCLLYSGDLAKVTQQLCGTRRGLDDRRRRLLRARAALEGRISDWMREQDQPFPETSPREWRCVSRR